MGNAAQNLDFYLQLVSSYAPKIVLAILVLVGGLWIIRHLTRMVEKGITRSGIDKDLRPFFTTLANLLMKVMLVLIVANMVGIETTSFVAILASLAFAVGLALQGSLGNFASGVMILIFKPYKVGDLVDIAGKKGYVTEIQVFNTILLTPESKTVIIPNGTAISGVITNFSSLDHQCIDIQIPLPFAVPYEKAAPHIFEAVGNLPKALISPAPEMYIDRFEAQGYYVFVKIYTDDDFYAVMAEAQMRIKQSLDQRGIPMGFPEDCGYKSK